MVPPNPSYFLIAMQVRGAARVLWPTPPLLLLFKKKQNWTKRSEREPLSSLPQQPQSCGITFVCKKGP